MTLSQEDAAWDLAIIDYANRGRPINELGALFRALYGMLHHGSDEMKKSYVATYMSLAAYDDWTLDYAQRTNRDDDDALPFFRAYETMAADYSAQRGVKEQNTDLYTLYLFHAAFIGDDKMLNLLYNTRPVLSYMDTWPGILKNLVKRRATGDSSVKVALVAQAYPGSLVRVLKNHLNFRDLALLLADPSADYDQYRNEVGARLFDLCRVGLESFRSALINHPRQEGETEDSYHIRMSNFRPQVTGSPSMSILAMLNIYFGHVTPAWREGPAAIPFSLYLNEASILVDFFAILTPTDASVFPNLVAYLVYSPGFWVRVDDNGVLTDERKVYTVDSGRFKDILRNSYAPPRPLVNPLTMSNGSLRSSGPY